MIDVTRDEFNAVKADIVDIKERLDDISSESKAVAHLVVGGINSKTGLVERGVIQSLDELVTQMKATNARFEAIFSGAKRAGVMILRWVLGLTGTAILSIAAWYLRNIATSITTTVTHTTTTVIK